MSTIFKDNILSIENSVYGIAEVEIKLPDLNGKLRITVKLENPEDKNPGKILKHKLSEVAIFHNAPCDRQMFQRFTDGKKVLSCSLCILRLEFPSNVVTILDLMNLFWRYVVPGGSERQLGSPLLCKVV